MAHMHVVVSQHGIAVLLDKLLYTSVFVINT